MSHLCLFTIVFNCDTFLLCKVIPRLLLVELFAFSYSILDFNMYYCWTIITVFVYTIIFARIVCFCRRRNTALLISNAVELPLKLFICCFLAHIDYAAALKFNFCCTGFCEPLNLVRLGVATAFLLSALIIARVAFFTRLESFLS